MSNNYQKTLFNVIENDMPTICEIVNIDIDSVLDGVNKISEWYKKQAHLPQNCLEKRHVIRVLLWAKNSVEKTKKIIDNYYSSRTLFPEVYSNRDPNDPTLLNNFKYCETVIMPILTDEYYRVVITRYSDCDYKEFDPNLWFKFYMMFVDLRMQYDVCAGDRILWDLKNVSLGNCLKFTPMLIKKMFYIAESSYPLSIKGIHLFNCPSYALSAVKIGKSAVKKKIADRIYVHDSLEDLHKHIDPKNLPKEYGGDSKTFSSITENILTAMQSDEWRKWYHESECLKSDESKRIQKSNDRLGELLGIEGSFRKLDID